MLLVTADMLTLTATTKKDALKVFKALGGESEPITELARQWSQVVPDSDGQIRMVLTSGQEIELVAAAIETAFPDVAKQLAALRKKAPAAEATSWMEEGE
jgi:hypothetical protein